MCTCSTRARWSTGARCACASVCIRASAFRCRLLSVLCSVRQTVTARSVPFAAPFHRPRLGIAAVARPAGFRPVHDGVVTSMVASLETSDAYRTLLAGLTRAAPVRHGPGEPHGGARSVLCRCFRFEVQPFQVFSMPALCVVVRDDGFAQVCQRVRWGVGAEPIPVHDLRGGHRGQDVIQRTRRSGFGFVDIFVVISRHDFYTL